MKKILFLLLFPCLALAQYPGNGNQKITLGEQTTADGLVWRGLAADTTRKPSVDTMAFILLDTNTNIIWQYKKAVNNAWTRVGGSISSGVTGVLPVANGGTGQTTLSAAGINTGSGSNNIIPKYTTTGTTLGNSSIFDNGNIGIGTTGPVEIIHVVKNIGTGSFFRMDAINGAPGIQTYRANGSVALPTAVMNNDFIGLWSMRGFDIDYNLYASAYIGGQASQDWTSTANGTILNFATTSNNSVSSAVRMTIANNGNVGIGQTSPTARLHLAAGTATASTAPLKFTSGTNLTTVEAGAMEFNGTNLFFSPSTTRHTVNHGLTGSATLDFLSTNTQSSRDMTIAVTGAADGDVVSLGVPNAAVNANTSYSAWVSAANTVTVRFNNYSSGTVDPASALFKVFVTK